MKYKEAHFLLSVASLKQLPPDEGMEVAFVGRSNAGKSSALNLLTQRRALAKVSKTPGRTRLINLFGLDENRRLVDLPGYGYAKVPKAMKEDWQRLLSAYIEKRQCLKGLVLLTDIRHPLKPEDGVMLEWALSLNIPVHVLLTKADKFSYSGAKKAYLQVQKALLPYGDRVTVQLFSCLQKQGLADLENQLNQWFHL